MTGQITTLGVIEQQGQAVVSSRDVARVFEKRHDNVLRDIRTIVDCNNDFNQLNFEGVEYRDAKGEMRSEYLMTRDGFTLLAMGFTGDKAVQFKIAYITAFNEMERRLQEIANGALQSVIDKQNAQIAMLTSIDEAAKVTGKDLTFWKRALIAETNRVEELKSEHCDIYRFYAEFKDRFVWDLVPTSFLYDLYAAYCKRFNTKIRVIGRTTFKTQLIQALDSDPVSSWSMAPNAVHAMSKMTQHEPLISEYNLSNWREIQFPCRFRGIVRKHSCQ